MFFLFQNCDKLKSSLLEFILSSAQKEIIFIFRIFIVRNFNIWLSNFKCI